MPRMPAPCSAATSALRPPSPSAECIRHTFPPLRLVLAVRLCQQKYHPIDDLDADAWKALNMRTRYYTARLHVGAFYLPAFLEEMLREVEEH